MHVGHAAAAVDARAGRRRRSRSSASCGGTCPAPAGRNTSRPERSAGSALPKGLRESDRLPEPIFTPATKEEKGKHDENIPFERMAGIVGRRDRREGARHRPSTCTTGPPTTRCRSGIIIADTKFEFGTVDGGLILIDEALTPDSSRFWPADEYPPGGRQQSFDKQFVRDYLLTLPWNKTAPGPRLPADVVEKTALKYREALKILTGKDIE